MPYIKVTTNASGVDVCKLEKKLGEAIALIPGKTERWLMTKVEDGAKMAFAGTEEPCVMAEVSLFGAASRDAYDKLTAELCRALAEATGAPENRVYVKYEETGTWGWSGSNF